MRLAEWLRQHPGENAATIARRAVTVSRQTVSTALRGAVIEKYAVAKAISLACNGEVTIAELCEPPELPK